MAIKIGYIDDKPALIASLKESLSFFEEVEFVLTATSAEEAFEKLAKDGPVPDVMLMDIEMDEMDGIETTRSIKDIFPEMKVIMFTVFDNNEKIFDALLAGASGYLLKDERPSRVVTAIQDSLEGRAPMSPVIAQKTLQLIRNKSEQAHRIESPEDFGITKREFEILTHISQGNNYQQISDILFISPKTVRNHIEKIYKKLHVHSKLEAVQLGMKNDWFEG